MIVRDWFYYVVWFIRLKKIVRALISEEEQREIDGRYMEMAKLAEGVSPGAELKTLKDKIK